MEELDAGALAAGQEAHELAVREQQPLQVQRHLAPASALRLEELLQLLDVLARGVARQGIGDGGRRVGPCFDSQHRLAPPGDSSREVPTGRCSGIKGLREFTRRSRYEISWIYEMS